MGHNIYSFIPGTNHNVGELRIGGRYRRSTHFYKALKVEQFNNRDSGSGDEKIFTMQELRTAEASSEITPTEQIFFQKCIKHCGKQGINILFS